jgi:hypothetical protein
MSDMSILLDQYAQSLERAGWQLKYPGLDEETAKRSRYLHRGDNERISVNNTGAIQFAIPYPLNKRLITKRPKQSIQHSLPL